MIFKFYPKEKGEHTHARMFVGEKEGALGLAGRLIMRNEEWTIFIATLLTGATHAEDIIDIVVSCDNESHETGKLPS